MAAAEPLEEPDAGASRRAEPAFPDQPAGVQGLSSEGKPGAVVELHLRRSHDQLPAEVDGSTEMAAAQAVRETRRYPIEIEALGGHRELLSNQGPHGCSRSREWEHPDAHQSRARLQESALPAAQGQATVGQQPRTPRRAPNHESHVICPLCQILAQSGKNHLPSIRGIVTNAVTGDRLRRAFVRLVSSMGSDAIYATATDNEGNFVIEH